MTKAEVIANAQAQNASEEEIAVLENTPEDHASFEESQSIPGCTDPNSINYNPKATIDDGSCKYEITKQSIAPTLPKLDPIDIKEEDPHEAFLIKPEFFGPANKTKTTLTEEKAKEYLDKKLSGLGINVEEIMPGKDVLEVGAKEGEEGAIVPLTRGLGDIIASLWDADTGYTNTDRANIINDIILGQVELLNDPNSGEYDEKLDYNTYVESYQKVLNNTPEVFVASEEGGRFLKLEELTATQLHKHRSRVHLDLITDYFKSGVGKEKLENIEKLKADKFNEIYFDILSTMQVLPTFDDQGVITGFVEDPLWAENAVKLFEERFKEAVDKIWAEDKDIVTMQYTTSRVVASMFDKDIMKKETQENIEGRYGPFIGKSDVISSFLTGATVTFPKEIQEFTAVHNGYDLQEIQKQIDILNNWEPGKKINVSYFETFPFEYKDENGQVQKVDLNFRQYNVSSQEDVDKLKQKALLSKTYKQMEVIGNLIEAQQYQEKLNGLTFADSELYKDGKFNVTADNWQRAVGDQTFRMMSSIFSMGMTTMVAEGGGMFAQALDGFGREAYGEDWDNPEIWDKKRKAEYLLKIIETHPEILTKAMQTGGINMMLENVSNVFFLGKIAKPVANIDSLTSMWGLFMKGKMKHAIQTITGNVKAKDIALTTLVETLTEGAQEEVTQYNIGSVLESHVHSWDPTINAATTAFLTTPIIHIGATSTKSFSAQLIRKIRLIKNREGILMACKREQAALDEAWANGKISKEKYDQETLMITTATNSVSEIDREYTHADTVEALYKAQMEIEKGKQRLINLHNQKEKAKKLYGEAYDETINKSENQDELTSAIDQIQKAELAKRQAKRIDVILTENQKLAAKINEDPNFKYTAETFESTDEAIEFLIKTVGIPKHKIDKLFASGEANAFIMSAEDLMSNFGIDFNGNGIAIVSEQNQITNIEKGDVFSQFAIHHEFEHMMLDIKSDAEIKDAWDVAYTEISSSKDPQMKEIKKVLDRRIKEYEKKFGKDYMNTRNGIEEKWVAIGEVCRALSIGVGIDSEVLTVEARESFLNIGKKFKELLHPDETINRFDAPNTMEFISKFPKSDRGTAYQLITETILDDSGNPVISIRYSLKDEQGGMDLALVREAANLTYPTGRSETDIVLENERLTEKIKEAENFVHEDEEMVKRVKEGAKRWRSNLMLNNWGHFENILKKYDRSHPLHSTLNEEMWNAQNLEQFTKAVMQTWQPKMLDKETGKLKETPFAAYYFGKQKPSPSNPLGLPVATLRQAAIWDMLDKRFTTDIENLTGETLIDYSEENTIDLSDQVEDYNERSELVHTIPGFEFDEETQTGNEAYEKWISNVQTTMVEEYSNVFDENFRSKIRKKGRDFWKQLKNSFDGKVIEKYLPTKLYNDWVTNSIELIYNQMPQKVMNENFTEFTEIITERMTAEESKMRKDLKTDDIYSGTSLRRKLEFTDEVREAFLEKLLKTNQIADLKAQGLSNREIHDIVRMDMTQEATFKHLADIIFKDAVMQATNTDAFKEEHGIAEQQIIQASIMLDRGMDVKFQLADQTDVPGSTIQTLSATYGGIYLSEKIGEIQREMLPHYISGEDINHIIGMIQTQDKFKDIPQEIKNFVSTLYENEFIKDKETRDFVQYIKTQVPGISQEVLDKVVNVNIRKDKDTRDNMVLNAKELMAIFPKEVIDVVGVEFLGFHFRGLDPGKGKEYNKDFNDVKALAKTAEELGIELGFDPKDISIYNKATPLKSNGIFKEYINWQMAIAKGVKTKKQVLKEMEDSNFLDRVEKANIANTGLLKLIYKSMAIKLKEGNLNEEALLQLFKMQSNLVSGFRGLSRFDGMILLDGKFKYLKKDENVTWKYNKKGEKEILWKGEHAASMSKVDASIIKLMYDYKSGKINDAEFNAAMDVELAGYGQILGHNGHFDEIDVYGATNIHDTYRFNVLPANILNKYKSIYGENMKDMQLRILLEKDRKQQILNTIKKAKVNEGIVLKNTTKGKVKGKTVMDFDETLHEDMPGESTVIFATKDGVTKEITAADWPNVGEQMIKEGWTMDFSEFDKVTKGKAGPLMQKLKNQITKYGVKDVHILTARSPAAASAIQQWLKSHGINLPLENITGLGNSTGEAKANWIEDFILQGYNDIYFVDDAASNVEAVQNMFDKYPPGVLVDGGKSVIVEASKTKTDNKVLFMVGGAGSGKSTIIAKGKFGDNYTILNPDEKMEADLKAAGLSLDRSIYTKGSPELSQWSKIQAAAIKDFKEQIKNAREEGKGIIIDATGASSNVMQGYYDAFAAAGYNIGAISVQTSLETAQKRNAQRERVLHEKIVSSNWESVQNNIEAYKKLFGDNFFQIFTDDMTMQDPLPADFVRDVSNFTMQNPIEFDNSGIKYSLGGTFNEILETSTDIGREKVYSAARAKVEGSRPKSAWDVIYPASAYDLEMFTYRYIAAGELGENQKSFFQEKLFIPFEKATNAINKARQETRNGYKQLLKELPTVKKNLKNNVEGTNYSYDQAIRVYLWTKNGIDIPGISKRDQAALVKAVSSSEELVIFADKLSVISQQKEGYVPPSEFWSIENIAYDLHSVTGRAGRAKYLAEWKQNVNEIFSKDNKNKLRVAFGNDHVEALEDMLYRMEHGTNRNKGGRIEQVWNNWVNNSVGAVMFFNMRSASLQTISAFNYIDWEDNNVLNAGKAFVNQPQYWKDFAYIFNSDYLKERRAGNKRTINEAELAAHVAGSTNKAKAAIAWLLEKGFMPTQLADSFAIASGGAAFYRNKIKAYEKQGLSTEEAQNKAWIDFQAKTEYGQQSSRPDLISQQQAGGLGRLILAFKNTPMQYNRLMIKSILDIKNKRGNLKTNLSKVAYYAAVQNVIFNSLQTALWSALGDEEEWDTKTDRVANGMIDSILNGLGLTGAIAATVKNGYLRYRREKKKGYNADHTRTIIEFANLSPTIGSKLRKLYGGIRTEQLNQGAIEEMGLTIENPAFSSLANIISATTNIPADRVVNKINNIILASSSENEAMDRIALLMGWNAWDLDIETKAKKVNIQVKEQKKKEKKAFDFKKRFDYNKKEEEKNIEKQKEEKKQGKKVTCSYNTSKGRCGLEVVKGSTRCTIHQKVEQRKDGKKIQCKKIKKDKRQCGVMTSNKSGYCYYHD